MSFDLMNMCARTKSSSAVQDLLEMFKLAHTMCTVCAIEINCNQGSLQILIVHLVLQVIAKTLLHNNYNFNQIWPHIDKLNKHCP